MMNTVQLRQQINQYLDQLSGDRLQTAADLLAYLVDQESEEATQELLDIPGFVESFERGKKDITEGRIAPWRAVRSDV
ncbi:MAG: hypothetical protein ACFE0I_16870 [Elainellaceae cyanobacterium]